MGAKLRSEIFQPDVQAIVHVMNRCVQQRFLLGYERETGKNYGHRRRAFEDELRKATSGFGIDMLAYAIMDNHFHLILRSRPDVVLEWSDVKVVRQWHKLCPIFKDENGFPIADPDKDDVAKVASDTIQVAKWRKRLSDISWFMKLVSQNIAKWCNAEDDKHGHFWESRFKAVLLLDERALLTCSMYVDLNRIQAELASSLEESDYTSVQRRLQAFAIRSSMRCVLAEQVNGTTQPAHKLIADLLDDSQTSIPDVSDAVQVDGLPDAHLSPIRIDEQKDPIGPHVSTSNTRCSDKGFLPMSMANYVDLLRWTADQIRHRQGGQKFDEVPPILEQLQLEPDTWCKLTTQFTDLFFAAAGMPESIDAHRSHGTNKQFYMPQNTREMLSA